MSDQAPEARTVSSPRTAAMADAILTMGHLPRVAHRLLATRPGVRVAGRARGVVHRGSVDAILEAIDQLEPGEVLVVDDAGRRDRACVGDLIALEAMKAGAAAMVIWGAHRDTEQLSAIELPIFSLGRSPTGPLPKDPIDEARRQTTQPRLGDTQVAPTDVVVGDDDGVLLVDGSIYSNAAAEAAHIEATEGQQAREMLAGTTFRSQVRFGDYIERRERDPAYTFRDHIASLTRTIER